MKPIDIHRMRRAALPGLTGVDSLPGIYARYDASILAGSVGSDVATWNDLVGSNHAVPDVTNAPQVGATINGLKTIAVSAGRGYKLPDAFLVGAPSAAWIGVGQKNGDPNSDIGSWVTVKRNGAGDSHHPYSSGVFFCGFAHDGRHTCGNPAASFASPRIYMERSAPSDWKSFIDGVQFFTTAGSTYMIDATPGNKKIGTYGGGSTWGGRIGELIFLNLAPTQATREKLEGYLAHKWGLAGSLDAGHPYKSTPPTF